MRWEQPAQPAVGYAHARAELDQPFNEIRRFEPMKPGPLPVERSSSFAPPRQPGRRCTQNPSRRPVAPGSASNARLCARSVATVARSAEVPRGAQPRKVSALAHPRVVDRCPTNETQSRIARACAVPSKPCSWRDGRRCRFSSPAFPSMRSRAQESVSRPVLKDRMRCLGSPPTLRSLRARRPCGLTFPCPPTQACAEAKTGSAEC